MVRETAGKSGLRGRSFWSLTAAQFLGAFNDNAYKMMVMLVVSAGLIASEGGAGYLAGSTAVFAIAYILFSATAGHLADWFSKRTIIVLAKVAEVAVMLLAFLALWAGDRITPIVVLFLMAAQSAFFSPAKYGILPELLDDEELSQGNGIINTTTYLGIIVGTGVSGWLMYLFEGARQNAALVLAGIAVVGTFASLFVGKVPPAGAQRRFRLNFLAEAWAGIRRVRKDRPLFLCILANMYLWVFGAVCIQNFTPYAREIMGVEANRTISTLLGVWCLGVAVGSLLAGRLSGRKIEFGMVPFGGLGMAVCSVAFAVTALPESYNARLLLTGLNLSVLGVFAGFYFVPLNAYVQQRSPSKTRGETIGVLNFITFCGVLVGAVGVAVLSMVFKMNPAVIFVALGILTAAVTVYICRAVPDFLIRFVVWLTTHTVYRFRVVGRENGPREGPALLVCNHVSLMDAGLITACFQRFVRFLMYREYYDHPLLHWAAKRMRAIPLSYADGPSALAEAFRQARKALVEHGELVCIFAEGSITRTGNLRGFRPGLERIVRGTDVPIIPVHLDRVWGSMFSFESGRVFWKMPRAIPYPVTVSFGRPMPPSSTAHQVRTAVVELGAAAFEYRKGAQVLLHHAFIRAAKLNWLKPCVADSTGRKMRYGRLLVSAAVLSHQIRRLTEGRDYVGLMLPASVHGVLGNIAALFAGKIPVNLNFTASAEAIDFAVEQCKIQTVITSREFVHRAQVQPMPQMVTLEDIAALITPWQKVRAALTSLLLPASVLRRIYSRRRLRPDDPATVGFTSGTTGKPKGVVQSHKNIAANIVGFCQALSLDRTACMCGVLPFFHSFGYTATLWAPILRYFRVVYHTSPLEAATIGRLIREHRATHLVTTPTFLGTYERKCRPGDMKTLKLVVVGAEKMKSDVADRFEEKFGIRPLEGYGCTELSPVAAVNVPDRPTDRGAQAGSKRGSIGQPLPNVAAKVVHVGTSEPLPPGEEGHLLVKGPNVMLGYLNQPGKTAEVIRDGWYLTGDMARIDEDGFITITDRLSRFSKIGGEMVPHAAVEDAIHKALDLEPGAQVCVVTSVPDEKRGERLAVLHTQLPVTVDELLDRLKREGALPRLWIPRKEMFAQVAEIPLLGTGKVALRKVREIAAQIGPVSGSES